MTIHTDPHMFGWNIPVKVVVVRPMSSHDGRHLVSPEGEPLFSVWCGSECWATGVTSALAVIEERMKLDGRKTRFKVRWEGDRLE